MSEYWPIEPLSTSFKAVFISFVKCVICTCLIGWGILINIFKQPVIALQIQSIYHYAMDAKCIFFWNYMYYHVSVKNWYILTIMILQTIPALWSQSIYCYATYANCISLGIAVYYMYCNTFLSIWCALNMFCYSMTHSVCFPHAASFQVVSFVSSSIFCSRLFPLFHVVFIVSGCIHCFSLYREHVSIINVNMLCILSYICQK